MTPQSLAIACVVLASGCTRSVPDASRDGSTRPFVPPMDVVVAVADAVRAADGHPVADSLVADATAADVTVRGPSALTRVPNVFEAGAQRPVVDRTPATPLATGARIEIRFDVENGSHRTRTATYQTLTGILRSPQLGLERRMGGSAAPTSCESNVQDDGRAMFFRCAGDVEDAHGRVWLDGDHVLLVMATSREDARPSSAPPSGTIERFTIPTGATVRFHAGHGALGM